MNAFDFVVTVALGSALATVIISKEVPLAEGLLAALQAIRSQGISSLDQVQAVVLETNGNFSVLRQTDTPPTESQSALTNVRREQ